MNIEIKDLNQLYILREGLATLNGENNFAVSILEEADKTVYIQRELDNALSKRKYIDDLIAQTDKLISENRPVVRYVSYKELKNKESRD